MKKYIPFVGLLFAFIALVSTNTVYANIAAGDIIVISVDNNPCDEKHMVRIVASYVNECVDGNSSPAPSDLTINLDPITNCASSRTVKAIQSNNVTINGRLFYAENMEVPDDPCVANTKDCKMEMLYYVTAPFELPECRWNISWRTNDARASNGINLVYDGNPSFYISSIYDNTIPCVDENTGPEGSPPNKDCYISGANNPAQFIDDYPVLSFCVGTQYHYALNAIDEDGDELRYSMLNAQSGPGVNVLMFPGLFPDEPFPSSTPIEFDSINGVLSFTPSMDYEATVVFRVKEYRDSCWIDNEGTWNSKKVLISTTTREARFIFGSFCTKETVGMKNYSPDPNDPDPTPDSVIVDTLEYDCAVMYLNIQLTYPILCTSIEPLGSDFRLVQGDIFDPDTLVAIDSAYSIGMGNIDWDPPFGGGKVNPYEPNCDGNKTENLVIKLNEPLGPGEYTLFLKTGDDYNTLTTMCGIEMEEYTKYTVIVNTKAHNLKFEMEDIFACRPQDPAPIAKVHPRYGPSPQDKYSWRYMGQLVDDDLAEELGGRFSDRRELVVDSAGTYMVTFTRTRCSYTDTFDVTIYNDMKLPELPDYHLCLTDEFPVIYSMREFLKNLEAETGKTISDPKWWLYSTKNPDGEVVSYFDTLETIMPGRYVFQVTVDLCILEEEFFITRQTDLDVDLGPDWTLCEGDSAFIQSKVDFKERSEDFLYEWYLNGEVIEDETSRSLPKIGETGTYSLKVYKESGCNNLDTVEIEVIDTLTTPEPECMSISYYEGQVFAWKPIEHAESYQVNEVYADRESGWIDAVPDDEFPSSHTSTYDVKYLYVRAVNDEVDETYDCKYSQVATTRQCDIIIGSPNVFTPNGDGKNDFLMFNLLEIFDGSQLQVFNRWGNLVYESNDYRNDWDGGDAPAGTYFYILNINDDRHEPHKGTFTLIR